MLDIFISLITDGADRILDGAFAVITNGKDRNFTGTDSGKRFSPISHSNLAGHASSFDKVAPPFGCIPSKKPLPSDHNQIGYTNPPYANRCLARNLDKDFCTSRTTRGQVDLSARWFTTTTASLSRYFFIIDRAPSMEQPSTEFKASKLITGLQ